jgi:predicted RNase H-like HicB family nuclease
MAAKKIVSMIVEKTETGFSAYFETDSIYTTGKNVSELINNAFEAAELFFEDQNINIDRSNIKFEIDLKQFFKHYKVLNAKYLAEKIGMNHTLLSQYVQGQKKPSERQVYRILTGIQQIGQELSGINLLQNS